MKVMIDILRPLNCLMAGVAAIIGALIAGGFDFSTVALIFLAVFLITGAGNVVNDYYDIKIDGINRPMRPMPCGRISPRGALNYSFTLFAGGCILSGLLNPLNMVLAIFNSALLFFYARDLKITPFAGNFCVAYLTGSTFIFGGAAFGLEGIALNLVPFLLSFLATMSREIAKDIEDIEGDRQGGARTLPLVIGEKASAALASVFALIAIILSYFAPFGIAYLIMVIFADCFFLISMLRIIRGDASGSQKALKIGMAIALIAFLAGALQRMS